EAYNTRGCVYKMMGDLDKARQDFKHTLQLNPDHSDAKENLASLK
ncbi:MAG: tetratricopeptide repeat protein, partial [Succinivibrio sp.]|nr:tetratricopeptide repeat protein [Succinivibrio sp.]